MASIKTIIDAHGNTVYKVQVSNGRGRRVTRTWRPEPGWSAKTIKSKLDQFAANLTNELADGTVKTKQEELEEKRKAAIEATKLKTMEQYATGVFMPAKSSIAENTRYSYQTFLDKHIFPKLGDTLLTDISTAMINKFLMDFQGEGYSHATVIKLYNVLNGVFEMAFKDDTIKVNPMLKVTRPTPRKDEKFKDERDKAYTPEELKYIFSCVDKEPMKWRVFIYLCADAWIRRGEECGCILPGPAATEAQSQRPHGPGPAAT
jgi:integrase